MNLYKTICQMSVLLCCILSAQAQMVDSIRWRQVFTEPQLANLIDMALKRNADLRTATLNVEQAEAQLKAARLSYLPSLTVAADGNMQSAKGQPTQKTYNIPLTMQWEVDLAGRLRGEKRAAVASYWSTAETERAVRLQLIAAVATHYYHLVMIDEQLAVTRESIRNAQQTMEVMQALKEVGMQNEAAVSAARATWQNMAGQEKTLLLQMHATYNALKVIIGETQDPYLPPRAANNYPYQQIQMPPYPWGEKDAVDLICLASRPDVKAAEYALQAQMAHVEMARAAFYPQLTISASAGWTNNVGEVLNPGKMLLSAIGSLVQPLFNKGHNRANLRIAQARQQQALVAFKQALLVAGTELNDALTACQLSSERLAIRQQEVAAAETAYEVSKDVMQNTSATYLEVLNAQQTLLTARQALVNDLFDVAQAKINLFKALGGTIPKNENP